MKGSRGKVEKNKKKRGMEGENREEKKGVKGSKEKKRMDERGMQRNTQFPCPLQHPILVAPLITGDD